MARGFCCGQAPLKEPPARFEDVRRRAETLVREPGRVQSLLNQAKAKIKRTNSEKWQALVEQLTLSLALVRAWLSGDYRQVSNKTVVILVAALLYFVMPLDAIPDFLFGWGLLDDAAVLTYVFSQLHDEIQTFKQWQERQGS